MACGGGSAGSSGRPLNRLLGGFFVLFNAGVRRLTRVYGALVGGLLRQSVLVLAGYGGLLVLDVLGVSRTRRPGSSRRRTWAIC